MNNAAVFRSDMRSTENTKLTTSVRASPVLIIVNCTMHCDKKQQKLHEDKHYHMKT